jgi:ABC-type uncharacterized transport system permease subunit
MSIIETYIHSIGLILTVVLLGGYITYRYLKRKK